MRGGPGGCGGPARGSHPPTPNLGGARALGGPPRMYKQRARVARRRVKTFLVMH